MLGTRQAGWADIIANTHNVDQILSSSLNGWYPTVSNIGDIQTKVATINDNVGDNVGNKATISDFLVDVLGTRNFGETQIQPATKNSYAILSNGTYGNEAIETELAEVSTDVDNIETKLGGNTGNQGTISDYLVNVLGLRQSGQVDIHADTLNANTILSALFAGTALKDRNAAAPIYPTPNAYNIAEDFVNTRTAVAIVSAISTILGERLGPSSSVKGDLLQNIIQKVLDFTGVEKSVTTQDMYRSYMPAPPIDQLTVDSYATVDSQDVITIPRGAYGARFILSVPSYWGRLDTWPYYYVPAVARIDYANTGFYGFNPIGIQTDFILAYPFPSWADSMVVSLGAGVTAERAWLYLPH